MRISMTEAGKRFNRDWIFRNFNYHFQTGSRYAITGHNGSGKSTLLQVIAGAMGLSEGKIELNNKNSPVPSETHYKHVSICAPYLELIEEMSASEFLAFHKSFTTLIQDLSIPEILAACGLEKTGKKQIRFFSSGMKQRLKLAQAVFSDTPVLLLDEPCTNLDRNGIDLYLRLIENWCSEKLIIVSSNDETEYSFCNQVISIHDYKS